MYTFQSWCSGIGGCEIGAIQAGLMHINSVEQNKKLYEIASLNFNNFKNEDVLQTEFIYSDFFHISPPCQNFSTTKVNSSESINDFEIIKRVVQYLKEYQPKYFTLENVPLYRKSNSFKYLYETLLDIYSNLTIEIYNMKNYGIPQTRKRLIVRAMNGSISEIPLKQPISWYSVLEKDIQNMPIVNNSKALSFKETVDLDEIILFSDRNGKFKNTYRTINEQAPTILATQYKGHFKIFDGENIRQLRVQDYAKLMTFPENYNFLNLIDSVTGLGNAVPPLFYKQIVQSLI